MLYVSLSRLTGQAGKPDVLKPPRRPFMVSEHNQASDSPNEHSAALPRRELSARQAEWLRDARARLLRRAAVTRRRHIVELGAGWGIVSEELARRSGGRVTAVDCHPAAAGAQERPAQAGRCTGGAGVEWLLARAEQLPLPCGCCDLVLAQFAFLWFSDVPGVVSEVCRILEPGGALAAIEPDFGGLLEYPPEIELKPTWIAAIQRAGGDPLVGRKLPGLLTRAGFSVDVQLPNRLKPPDAARFELLAELPLTVEQQDALRRAQEAARRAGQYALAHLPMLMIYAEAR